MWKNLLILFVAVLSINSASGQRSGKKILITGTVMDVYNGPITNAILMVDNQKTNIVTDSRGKYQLKVNKAASKIGVFTFGNGLIEQDIKGRNLIDFNFSSIGQKTDQYSNEGDQGVNTGYGTVKKKYLTTDVNKIDGTDKKYSTYSSIYEMIKREVSGVQVNGSDVVIQDSQNMFGYVHPLIVVDGVYMDQIPDLPPVSVKSIQVLKGASATIYGSRGMGGAIVINTKLSN
jgi:TonB-dependent SusC/RagA subfamily outer membrane receptor